MKRRFSPLRSVGVGLAVALAACDGSSTAPVDPLFLSVSSDVSVPTRVFPGDGVEGVVSFDVRSNGSAVVDSARVVRFVGGDSVSSDLYVRPVSGFVDRGPALGSGDAYRVSVDVFASSVRGDEVLSRLSSSSASTSAYRLVGVDFAMKTFFDEDVHDGVSLRVRHLVTGEESLYSSEGGRVSFETVAGDLDVTPVATDDRFFHLLGGESEELHLLVSDGMCVPTSLERPSWRLSVDGSLEARVYSVDDRTDVYAVLDRHGDPVNRFIGGESYATRGQIPLLDPRISHTSVRILGGFSDPFLSFSWEPDRFSSDPDGMYQRFKSAFLALQSHPAIPAGCRVPQVDFVDADRETFMEEHWDGSVSDAGYTARGLPGRHTINRRLESRVSRHYVADEQGNVFLSRSDMSGVANHLLVIKSEHALMGVSEATLSNPIRCIPGNNLPVEMLEEFFAACYNRSDNNAPLAEVADRHAPDFSEDLTRTWLLAKIGSQGYYDLHGRSWYPYGNDHPVWERILSRQPQGAVLGMAPPEGYVRSEGGIFVPPSASRSVGDAGLALRSAERVYRVPGIGAPVYFDK